MGETWGIRNAGTARRQGDQLCIAWQDAANAHCYGVVLMPHRMLALSGPRMIEGKLDAADRPSSGTTSAAPPQTVRDVGADRSRAPETAPVRTPTYARGSDYGHFGVYDYNVYPRGYLAPSAGSYRYPPDARRYDTPK